MKSSVSILIPIVDSKVIHETIDSVICQDLSDWEVGTMSRFKTT